MYTIKNTTGGCGAKNPIPPGNPGDVLYLVSSGVAGAASNVLYTGDGNLYAANSVTTTNVFATRYYGDGGLLSNIAASAITQPFANLVVSNSVTTTNVFATRYYGDGGLLSNIAASAITQPFANLVVSNSVTTTNIFATSANIATMNVGYLTVNSAVVYGTSTLNVYGISNLSTTTVNGSMTITGNLTCITANVSTLNVWNVSNLSTLEVTNNLYAANAVTTTNVFAAMANVGTLNVWQVSNLVTLSLTNNLYAANAVTTTNVFAATEMLTGATGKTTLNITGNVYASNALTTTNVFATTTNTQVLSVTSNMTFTGPLATLSNLTVPGNANIEYLSVSNLSVTGNLYVTATNLQTTNALTINNSGTMTALKVTQNETSIHTHNVAEFWDATTLAMVIDPEGNVAIHTVSSPNYSLTVTDPANFETLYIRGKNGTPTLNVIGNITVSNSLTTTNVFAATANVGTLNVWQVSNLVTLSLTNNLYAANAVTTTNVFAATANVGTLNVWQVSNLVTLSLTNNLYAANAVTTTNVFATTVSAASLIGTHYGVLAGSNTISGSTQTLGGTSGLTSLNVTGNVYASNAVTMTNAFVSSLNFNSTNYTEYVSSINASILSTDLVQLGQHVLNGTPSSRNVEILGECICQANNDFSMCSFLVVLRSNIIPTVTQYSSVSNSTLNRLLNINVYTDALYNVNVITATPTASAQNMMWKIRVNERTLYGGWTQTSSYVNFNPTGYTAVPTGLGTSVISNSQVGIGTLSPSSNLYVVGNIYASNALTTTNVFVSGNVGIGTANPQYPLEFLSKFGYPTTVQVNGEFNSERIRIFSSNATAGTAVFLAAGSRGTSASPAASLLGDQLGYYQLGGHDGVNFQRSSWITGSAEENWSATNRGSNIIFSTTPIASTTITERMRITAGGNVGIGTATPTATLQVVGNIYVSNAVTTTNVFATTVSATNVIGTHYGVLAGANTVATSTATASTAFVRTPGLATAAFQALGASLASTSFNYILSGANDTLNRLVIFVNGSARTADGGVSNVTIRNDGGSLILGNASYPTIVYGSNVGIGTTSPAYKLDIGNFSSSTYTLRLAAASVTNGTMGTSIRMMEADDTYGFSFQNLQGRLGVFRHSASSGGAEVISVLRDSLNVGIGTASPQFIACSAQDISATTDIQPNTAQFAVMGSTAPGKRMVFGYDTQIAGNGHGFIKAGNLGVGWSNIALQPNGGNVGIGTTTPTYKLDVIGTSGSTAVSRFYGVGAACYLYLDNDNAANQVAIQFNTAGATRWVNYVPASTSDLRWYNTADRMALTAAGNVGIGVVAPIRTLHVVGEFSQTPTAAGTTAYYNVSNSVGSNGGSYTLVMRGLGTSGGAQVAMAVFSVIAVSSTFSGTVTATGDITAFSDRRHKTNLVRIENAIDKISSLNGYTFNRTDEEDKEKRHVGVVAQEVLKVLPEAVHKDKDGMYSVAYGNLTALLIEALKEEREKREALEKRLERLEKLIQ